MKNPSGYSAELSAEVGRFISSLPKRQRNSVFDLLDKIAASPHGISDYQCYDGKGRLLETVSVDRYLITFWLDHAVKELRVVEVEII